MLIHRADHSLEDLKVKLFGSKREKTQAPAVFSSVAEAIPSFPLEGKRKERSLSSLVISTPKIGTKSLLPRKRLKSIARKSPALRESILAEELLVKKVDDCCHESLSSPETLSKILQAKRQVKEAKIRFMYYVAFFLMIIHPLKNYRCTSGMIVLFTCNHFQRSEFHSRIIQTVQDKQGYRGKCWTMWRQNRVVENLKFCGWRCKQIEAQ